MTPELTPVVTDEQIRTLLREYFGAPDFCPDPDAEIASMRAALAAAFPPSPDGMAGRLAEVLRSIELDERGYCSACYVKKQDVHADDCPVQAVLAAYDAQTRETEGTLTLAFNSTDSGVDAIGSIVSP
jgi:hypothetical protein